MTDQEQQRLIALLTDPRETLSTEYKSWLNLKEDNGRAKLAKAAIALANVGGGTIILGMSEPKTSEESWSSLQRPDEVLPYTEDMVGAAISKYADPMPDCALAFAVHPSTKVSHAIVIVRGGLTEPVIAKKSCKNELIEHRCYIRKLGPARSEEPKSALEWRELLQRCALANRDSYIDAIRGIFDGRFVAAEASASDEDNLVQFARESKERWLSKVNDLPDDDPARLPHGWFEFCFSLPSVIELSGPKELNDVMDKARKRNHSSYGPFRQRSLESHQPYTFNGALEAWMGNPEGRKSWWLQAIGFSFWRATWDGHFYHIEGLYDDIGMKGKERGKLFELCYPIRRVGAFLIFASQIAVLFGNATHVLVSGRYSGLQGRSLYRQDDIWDQKQKNRSHDDAAMIGPRPFPTSSLQDNLAEVTHASLKDMYEKFWFVKLKREFVAAQIELLKKQGY